MLFRSIPNTDWVGDRAGANFCDEFEFMDAGQDGASPDQEQQHARDALNSLFGEGGGPAEPKGNPLDDLFGE